MLELIAKTEKSFRPLLTKLPSSLYVSTYSKFRNIFLRKFSDSIPAKKIALPSEYKIKLWDIQFDNGLFNAAGMFKNGYGYEKAYRIGAGAFLIGTSTTTPRVGNIKSNIKTPFAPLPRSKAALNWLGLPNPGHLKLSKIIRQIDIKYGCPLGVSVSLDPGPSNTEKLDKLISGFGLFIDSGATFAELNESCPNVQHTDSNYDSSGLDKNLINRLEYIYEKFIKRKKVNFPIILKFSNDTNPDLLPAIIDMALDFRFDGINFGNTSVNYDLHRNSINKTEINCYDYFINNFGGGLSGNPLKESSLRLATFANEYLTTKNLSAEFHIIRTGGIDNPEDLLLSRENGIELNQWYTGFFENYAHYGNKLYLRFFP